MTNWGNLPNFSGKYRFQHRDKVCKDTVLQHWTSITWKLRRASRTTRKYFTLTSAACWKCKLQQVTAVLLLSRFIFLTTAWIGGESSLTTQRNYDILSLFLLIPLPSPPLQYQNHFFSFTHLPNSKCSAFFVCTLFKPSGGEVGAEEEHPTI